MSHTHVSSAQGSAVMTSLSFSYSSNILALALHSNSAVLFGKVQVWAPYWKPSGEAFRISTNVIIHDLFVLLSTVVFGTEDMFRAGAKQGYRETSIKGCSATINEYCVCSFYITRTIYGLGMFINLLVVLVSTFVQNATSALYIVLCT